MAVSEKDLRLIRKGFENKNERNIDKSDRETVLWTILF